MTFDWSDLFYFYLKHVAFVELLVSIKHTLTCESRNKLKFEFNS